MRALQLHVENDSKEGREAFRFRAGQWVDFFVPGLDKVGGFSMVSTPEDLPVLRLAVKKADFAPPARWVHHEAQVRWSVTLVLFDDGVRQPAHAARSSCCSMTGGRSRGP